ncbi:hypothetical protein [Pseudoalteromonas phenolica]|uniref:DUF304 domain-containing protein n=1 Tax=Pseudoalteromonas phenolica TaxID=161398 RepID=A0A0S2K5L9_9GAMM|nr:hypothetical protein [Pseudoalteromonas phenolica]ALO43696.1 hypothetical protein PP2015_3218 [Pseudoalteromonas phenolica]MBE0355133.1 hypothetical protein [Pseudoalteromonas phenolica O-BC30]RXE94851.1 hypothetical protein D9981_17610 [Pseudoalteromonas phenolica O-BC30]
MHTVDLNSNKTLLFISFSFGIFSLALVSFELVSFQLFKWLGFTLVFSTVVIATLQQKNKMFVHINRAGISYGIGFTVRYIHQESVQSISSHSSWFGDVLIVKTRDNNSIRFYAWQVSETDLSKAERLLAL